MHDQTHTSSPTTLPALHLGAPTVVGPLTLFPIWTDAPVHGSAVPLELPRHAALSECDDGPQVETLVAANPTAKPFALLEGTIVDGGWQHRVLVESILVGAGSTLNLPVRCVEQGRWHGDGSQRVHGRRAPLGVRGAVRGIRRDVPQPDRRADQSDVWSRVAHYEQAYGSSATSSLVEVFDQTDVPREIRLPKPLLGQRGVLVGVCGHPALVELFEHPRSLARQWNGLVDGLLRSSLHVPAVPTTTRRARAFVDRLTRRAMHPSAPAGDGFLAGIEDNLVSVRSLNTVGRQIHVAALNVRHDLVLAA